MEQAVAAEFWVAAIILGVFVIYVVAKVRMYMRQSGQSDAEWQQVDKSRLKTWVDDDD